MPRATIPPLDWRAPIVDPKTGNPSLQFMRFWQQLFGNEGGTYDTVTDPATGLDTKVPQTRLINTTAPLNGGGDLTNDLNLTHNASGVTAATYGDATHVPQFTVNATGHVTAASNVAFSGGTVTSVSVVTANGVSGTVATPTTTPAITLTLGAITPSSVAATGTVTGSNLSGTNTGDQTITLTGDVTGSGTGSFAATIAAGAVTLAKQANVATSTLFYRKTAGTGAPEVNTLATLKADLGLTGTNSGDQTVTSLGILRLVAFFFTTTPTTSEVLCIYVAVDAFTIPANMSGSQVKVGTNSSATFAIDMQQNGASIGTISISTLGVVTLTTTSGASKAIAVGDIIKFVAPATPDTTIANVAVNVKGTL